MKLFWYINRKEKLVVLGPPGNGNEDWEETVESGCVDIGYTGGPCLTREAIGVLFGAKVSWLNYRISLATPYAGGPTKPLSLVDAM